MDGEMMPSLPGMEGALNPVDGAQLKTDAARRVFEVMPEWGPWMEDYYSLVAEGWTWRQAVYIVWASLPKSSRIPGSQGELARQVLGLTSDRVIRDWRERNPMLDARVARMTAGALARARAEIYQALITAATSPDPRAHSDRKLALEMLGDYMPRQRVDVGAPVPDEWVEVDVERLRELAWGGEPPLAPPSKWGGQGDGDDE